MDSEKKMSINQKPVSTVAPVSEPSAPPTPEQIGRLLQLQAGAGQLSTIPSTRAVCSAMIARLEFAQGRVGYLRRQKR